jgi:hypothetical protein
MSMSFQQLRNYGLTSKGWVGYLMASEKHLRRHMRGVHPHKKSPERAIPSSPPWKLSHLEVRLKESKDGDDGEKG